MPTPGPPQASPPEAPRAAAPPPAAPALDTALTGPAARGLRGARAALAFYAAEPGARPRPAPLDRAVWAAAQVANAARLVATDRALRRAALVPTALTAAGCALLAAVSTTGRIVEGSAPSPLATFQAFLVAFVALASMPPTVLQRMWIRVALEARRALGLPAGEDPFPGAGWARLAVREGWKAFRQFLTVSIGLAPLLFLVKLLPFGTEEAAVLGAAWAFYWIVVDAYELPIEVVPGPRGGAPAPWYARLLRRAGARLRILRPLGALGRFVDRLTRPWREEVHFTERHAAETAGFGAAVGIVLAVPGLGLFFRAIAIVAATAQVGALGPAPALAGAAVAEGEDGERRADPAGEADA